MFANCVNDARHAFRFLSRTPGFAAAAIVTVALGIGVNTGIFTVLNGVLFRDVPVPDAHQLVAIQQTVEGGEFTAQNGLGTFTLPEYETYRDSAESLQGLLAHAAPRETTLGGDVPERVLGSIVSCNYFDVLEMPTEMGRALAANDCAPGADPVVLLGHDVWMTRFAGDLGIVGQTIELNRNLFTVVGVASEDAFSGTLVTASFFAPLSAEPLLWTGRSRFEDDAARWLYFIGRRADDASVSQVEAELGVIAARIDQDEPGRSTELTIDRPSVGGLPHDLQGLATGAAFVLLVAFGLILLIACANVANLLLARGTARAKEIGIRLSLGASRARIIRQMLAESLVISLIGGIVGSLLALWSFQALFTVAVPTLIPPEVPAMALDLDFSPDYRVFAYALALTLATGVLFGLAPALHVSKPDLNTVIKQDVSNDGGRRGGRLRSTLVGSQVALSMVLVIATGLLLRGLQATYSIDPGFESENVVHVSFGTDGAPDIVDQALLDQIAALPQVDAVASAMQTPLGEARVSIPMRLPEESADDYRLVEFDTVTADYFSLLEIPILRGRAFTQAETGIVRAPDQLRPAIVTESTARNLWGDEDPIGQTLVRRLGQDSEATLQVVGVAADAQLATLGRVEPYYVIEPGGPRGEVLVRSRSDFASIAASLREIVQARDPSLAFRVLPLEGNLGYFRGASRILATLSSGLGVLALVLAAVGIYGVVAYSVSRRYREIGIRMALGAEAINVLSLLLRRTMRPVVIGAVVGLAFAVALSRVLSRVLFGVSPADPAGLGLAAALVIGVAIAAGVLAARPATRTEPTSVLRHE